MSALAAAINALFADPSVATEATYTAAESGSPVSVRIVTRRPDVVTDFGGGRVWSETTRVDVRVIEVPTPSPGGTLAIGGEAFVNQGEPVRDGERLIWTIDLRPA